MNLVVELLQPEVAKSIPSRLSKPKTSISVGIPAFNEEGRIGYLYDQILNQNEVTLQNLIFNISGSTDGTRKEIRSKSRSRRRSFPVVIIDDGVRAGKAEAINGILKASKSEIVILIDGDVKLGEGCIKEILQPFIHDSSIGVVSGNVFSLNNTEDIFSFISKFERDIHDELCSDLIAKNQAPKVNGTFFAMKKDVVDHMPHRTVSDDEYVSWAAQMKGYRIAYAPRAIVYTKDPGNYRDYLAKRRRIFAGHKLIKKTVGYDVPTTRLGSVMPRLIQYTLRNRRKIVQVSIMLFLQFWAYILASFDVSRGDTWYRYRVESAKFQPVAKKQSQK